MVKDDQQKIFYDKGKNLFSAKEYQSAYNEFRKIDIQPLNFDDKALVYHYMAMCMSYLGKWIESLDLFERAKQYYPEFGLVHFNQGLTYFFFASAQKYPEKWYEMALKCFKQSLFQEASNPEAWYYRGLMHKLLGQEHQAKYSYENVFTLAPRFQNLQMCEVYEKMYIHKNLSSKKFSDNINSK